MYGTKNYSNKMIFDKVIHKKNKNKIKCARFFLTYGVHASRQIHCVDWPVCVWCMLQTVSIYDVCPTLLLLSHIRATHIQTNIHTDDNLMQTTCHRHFLSEAELASYNYLSTGSKPAHPPVKYKTSHIFCNIIPLCLHLLHFWEF